MIPISFPGHLGADPEIRVLDNGSTVLKLRIAARSSFGQDAGTEWFSCDLWGERAKKFQEWLHKGSHVFVYGTFSTRQYEKDGEKRISLEVRIDNLEMLDKKPEGDFGRETPTRPERPVAKAGGNPFRR